MKHLAINCFPTTEIIETPQFKNCKEHHHQLSVVWQGTTMLAIPTDKLAKLRLAAVRDIKCFCNDPISANFRFSAQPNATEPHTVLGGKCQCPQCCSNKPTHFCIPCCLTKISKNKPNRVGLFKTQKSLVFHYSNSASFSPSVKLKHDNFLYDLTKNDNLPSRQEEIQGESLDESHLPSDNDQESLHETHLPSDNDHVANAVEENEDSSVNEKINLMATTRVIDTIVSKMVPSTHFPMQEEGKTTTMCSVNGLHAMIQTKLPMRSQLFYNNCIDYQDHLSKETMVDITSIPPAQQSKMHAVCKLVHSAFNTDQQAVHQKQN